MSKYDFHPQFPPCVFLFFTISIQVAALKCVESPESLILINTISSGRCQCQGVNSNWRACTVQACDEQAAAAGWLAGWTHSLV